MDECLTCSSEFTCDTCDLLGATPFYTDTEECHENCTSIEYLYILHSKKECYTS